MNRKILGVGLSLLLIFATVPVDGQNFGFTTRALQEMSRALTAAGRFGVPRYTTALLPTCGTTNKGAVAYDTTLSTLSVCSGSAWASAGGATLAANTFTGIQTISASNQAINLTGTNPYIQFPIGGVMYMSGAFGGRFGSNANQTPDTMVLLTGSLANSLVFGEEADQATDFGHALQTHPTIFVQSANAGTVTQYLGISAHGTQSELFKTLTETTATSLVQVPVAANTSTGGVIYYTVFATDGTDTQSRSSSIRFTVVNKAATETCAISGLAGANDASITELEDGNASALSSGTLTYALTCDTSPTNGINIQLSATSSLTQTLLRGYYTVIINGPGSPLLQ